MKGEGEIARKEGRKEGGRGTVCERSYDDTV
jgi:hypothetical protein